MPRSFAYLSAIRSFVHCCVNNIDHVHSDVMLETLKWYGDMVREMYIHFTEQDIHMGKWEPSYCYIICRRVDANSTLSL